MPDVGTGSVPIHPDFSKFGKELQRGVGPHIDAAGKDMEQTFSASAKKSAASVDKAFDHVADKAKKELKNVPITADSAKLDASVVAAAKKAAAKAADELSRIPGGVDAETFQREVSAAAQKAANEAATRLANIPAGVDASKLQAEVAAAAAKAARPIEIDVNADTSDFRKLPSEIRPHVKKAGDDIERTFASSAKGAGKAIASAIGVGLAIGFGKELLELGNQTAVFQQKTKTVFEDSTEDVQRWAKENNRALGLTETRLAGLAANFGDLLKPMGFTAKEAADLSTKALDLAGALSAWSGGTQTVADVSATLSKALLGEREELKGLGIAISEADVSTRLLEKGQSELVGTSLAQAKAVATQELIFEKSTDAQKAWADGSFDAIKKQNELRAKVSELVEVVATGLLPVFTAAAGVLTSIPGPAIAAAAAFGAIVVTGLGIKKAAEAVGSLSTSVKDLVANRGGLSSTGASLGRVAGGAAGLAGLALIANELDEAFNRWNVGPPPNLAELTNSLVRFQQEGRPSGALAKEFGDDLGGLTNKIKTLNELGDIAPDFATVKRAKQDVDALDQSLTELVRTGQQDLADSILKKIAADAGVSVPEVVKHLDGYRDSLTEIDTEQRLAGKSSKDLGEASGVLGKAVTDARDDLVKYADELRDAYSASQDLIGSSLNVAGAVDALRDSAADTVGKETELAAAIRSHGAASNEAKAAGEALEDARRRQLGDVDALAQANVRLAEQQALAAGKTLSDRDKYALYREELIRVKDTLAPDAPLRKHLEGLINQLPPPVIKSEVVLDTAKWEASLRQISAVQAGLGISLPFVGQLGRRHDGGMVGGKGYEVPILAQPGEYVMQKSAVAAIGADNLARLNQFHAGGMVGGTQVLDRIARVAEPVTASASAGTNVTMGGVVINGVPDAETALTRLPTRLSAALYLAGG